MKLRPAASIAMLFATMTIAPGCAGPSHHANTAAGSAPNASTTQPTADVLDEIIAAITESERRVRTVRIESFDLTFEEAADAKSDFKPTPQRYQGSAWFDMGDGLSNYGWARARVRYDHLVLEWEDGAAPWFEEEADVSFDGKRGRSISIAGAAVPGGTRHRKDSAWIYDEPPPLLCDPGLQQGCGLAFTLWWSQQVTRSPDPPRTSRQPQFGKYLAECKQNGKLPQIGHERVNDVDTVRLRWESELKGSDGANVRSVRTWWLDPARGYSLIRRERTSSNTSLVRRLDVMQLIEVAPGVWYPTAGVLEDVKFIPHPVQNAERGRERRHFKATGVSINEPIPDELFSPTIPPGYFVIDAGSRDKIYVVQPDATTRPMRDVETRPRGGPGTLDRPN